MECIMPIVTLLCGRLKDAFGSAAQTQAEGGFSFLGGLAGGALLNCFREWRNKVILQPTETTTLVGAEETLKNIRSHLLGNEVNVVGIVGMGGVGKTTLLSKINNDLCSQRAVKFDIVIFATVSREGDALKVQKVIAKRLGLQEPSDKRAVFDALSGKRYLLLLDDVWGELDLKEIGVPFPNKENRCKIALTTRFSDVFDGFARKYCRPRDRALQLNVDKLNEARSWELFRSMMDRAVDLDDPCIMPHAEKMVQKCDGLPLALVTMGRTMATATSPAEWRKAERQLQESPYRVQGMDEVQSNLMFSIDRLKEQGTLFPCFLYCSLFPEDGDIKVERLIEHWIGEGFLDVGAEEAHRPTFGQGIYGTIQCARDEGEIVVKQLKDLCLLETGSWGCVKMHDLVRELALVLGKMEPNRCLVDVFDGWEEATRVSLMNCRMDKESVLLEIPRGCPRMSTLLTSGFWGLIRHFPDKFFTSMRNLVVLDLSALFVFHTIPTSICLLSELRYLSLRGTHIHSLPEELGNLVKLRQLDLSYTYKLDKIPPQAILRLSNLQVLKMIECGYKWGYGEHDIEYAAEHMKECGNNEDDDDCHAAVLHMNECGNNENKQLSLSDLEKMKQLQDVRIRFGGWGSLRYKRSILLDSLFKRGYSLSTSITELYIDCEIGRPTTTTLQSALQSMTNLRRLTIFWCRELTGELILDGNTDRPMLCELEYLSLMNVPLSAITIIEQMQWGGPLQKLKELCLVNLKNLEIICDPLQCLPSLEYLVVSGCPLLRTLPLGPHSKIKEIICSDREWWKRLQWRQDQGGVRRMAEEAVRFENRYEVENFKYTELSIFNMSHKHF